jgi:pyridoxamine 5'-phosphate oxidase
VIDPLVDPLATFEAWWRDARAADPSDLSSAMTLSTVDERGRPSSRVVLLRSFDARGFVFYTNLHSAKGAHVARTPYAALCFHFTRTPEGPLGRQVRVEGRVERVGDDEADAYFASRPRESQLGAWASDQSRPLDTRDTLFARLDAARARFDGRSVERPPHWSGLRVIPEAIELWREGAARLHVRERFERDQAGAWRVELLFP